MFEKLQNLKGIRPSKVKNFFKKTLVNSVRSIINIEQISKIKGGKENQVGNSQDFY